MEFAIEVTDIWKKFRLYNDRAPTLKEKVLFTKRSKHEDLWVLKGVNLCVEKGKTIGLIGQNGSGKSTLLKLMTRIIYPDQGGIRVRGKVSSLLELGAGFHPDFSGMENIYMNAAIFGLTKKEIDGKIDEIISFSELEEFIDSPVRTYSSGMYMRLAFSIAINVEPDILLIDEILAVGDENFQKKCFNKMKSFKSRGTTIVIVSHGLGSLEMLCDEIAWLHEGTLVRRGIPAEVVGEYRAIMSGEENQRVEAENHQQEERVSEEGNGENLVSTQGGNGKRWGDGSVEIVDVVILDHLGQRKFTFECGESCVIEMHCNKHRPVASLVFGIAIYRRDDLWCYGTNTFIDRHTVDVEGLDEEIIVRVSIDKLNLMEGEYYLNVATHDEYASPYDYQTNRVRFSIYSNIKDSGVCRLEHQWSII
ncbi:ABC transporter ATP-binding protein [Desulfosporosinus metallidurans]|uniref:Teichoic acid export ATP-binding protein TagH n=1 Tax=Desulfosporosinus metallidurans TaxID=1888891 RepID=A0A1Q8QXY8_9FIRM|nr:ABC transporter ATP-binding protein [Desulfosporosinus metallidurans]OLN32165.1 Teichoic acid export ATP-binding protein TagH [Desulfosporosinus metallidurans]